MNSRRSWKFSDGLLLAALTGLAVAATYGVWQDIFSIGWRSDEQSHILLTPIIVLWLIWVRRERLRYAKPSWSMLGPLLVGVGWFFALWGFQGWGADDSLQLFWHFGALLIVFGAVVTVIGLDLVRAFFPAALALLFLLPVPGRVRTNVSIPLQEYTAIVTEWMLDIFGVAVVRSGSVLSLNGQDIAVAEACNGMRMVAALGLISFAFVFSTPMRHSVRLAILAISPLIALIVNVIRLTPTVLLYGYSDPDFADAFHDFSGWAMLGVALGLLWGLLALLRWIEVPITPYAVSEA